MARTKKDPATEKQKRAAAFAARRIAFEPKSPEQKAAEQRQAEEKMAIEKVSGAREAIANDDAGYLMLDGTIYAGISPDTREPMYITGKDAAKYMDLNKAAEYASQLDANSHKDWRLPTKEELNVVFQNSERGALKGTFNLAGPLVVKGWYWTSSIYDDFNNYAQCFSNGVRHELAAGNSLSVRCIRG